MRLSVFLLFLLAGVAVSHNPGTSAGHQGTINLKPYAVVLEDVRAKPIDESSAVFSFVFKGKNVEFLLTRKVVVDDFEWLFEGVDSTGYTNWLVVISGGWETPEFRGFLKINGISYHLQPSYNFEYEFPELYKVPATIAIAETVLRDSFMGQGAFNSTIPLHRDMRNIPGAPSSNPITKSGAKPRTNPPQPCPSQVREIVLDTVTDGYVYSFVDSVRSNPEAAIRAEAIALTQWMAEVYKSAFRVSLAVGKITIEDNTDNNIGAGWRSGGTSWNRDCSSSFSSSQRSAWYGDTLDSFSCWVHEEESSTLRGGVTQLLHGCSWGNTGGTVGLGWIGVPCRSQASRFGDRCAGKTSVSNFRNSALYLIAAHEVGHNFGVNHDTANDGIMAASVSGQTQFSRSSQTAFCNHYGGSSGGHQCAEAFSGTTCSCPAGQTCDANNNCVAPCQSTCGAGDECGNDGCGGECNGGCPNDSQICNQGSKKCEFPGNGLTGFQNQINAERQRWGSGSVFVDEDLSDCLQAEVSCNNLVFPSACGSGYVAFFGYGGAGFSDDQAIQTHLDDLLPRGNNYQCDTDSFSQETAQIYATTYRRYVTSGTNFKIGLGVLRSCPWGANTFAVAVMFSVNNLPSPAIESSACVAAGASCSGPRTCEPTGSCQLHDQPDGCNGGWYDCPCPSGQACDTDTGFCEVCSSCFAEGYDCGVVRSCSGQDESCGGECEGDDTCYIKEGERGGVCCTPRTSCDDFCGTLTEDENCGQALECSPCEEKRQEESNLCECPSEGCFPSYARPGCETNPNCPPCTEGFTCSFENPSSPTCVATEHCCSCPNGVYKDGDCVPTIELPHGCQDGWVEYPGLYEVRDSTHFVPSGDCVFFSSPINEECPNGVPYCPNLYIFENFESFNPGDGVIADITFIGDSDEQGIIGLVAHGSFESVQESISSKYWAGILDFKNKEIGSGVYSFSDFPEEKGIYPFRDGITTQNAPNLDSEDTYRVTFFKRNVEDKCEYRLAVDSLEGDLHMLKDVAFPCGDFDGTKFGLLSNSSAKFTNVGIVSAATVSIVFMSSTCPTPDQLRYYVAGLVGSGVLPRDIIVNSIECTTNKRQATAVGFPVSFTITSQATPAAALASRFEFLVAAQRLGAVTFDTASGLSSSAGGAPITTTTTPIQPAPTTGTVVGAGGSGGGAGGGSGGAGGGSGGLSSGAIAGIVVGSVVAVALVGAAVAVAVKKSGDGGGGSGGSSYSSGGAEEVGGGKKNKGVPVMNPESHQRRVIEGEMTSVGGRGAVAK